MSSCVVVLDSDDDEIFQNNGASNGSDNGVGSGPDNGASNGLIASTVIKRPLKRLTPKLLSSIVSSPSKREKFGASSSRRNGPGQFKNNRLIKLREGVESISDDDEDEVGIADEEIVPVDTAATEETGSPQKDDAAPPATSHKYSPELQQLVAACKAADSSRDMDRLLRSKLLRYYLAVSEEFRNSKGFRSLVRDTTASIKKEPHLVYITVKAVVEELKSRQKEKRNEELTDEERLKETKRLAQLKKLEKALAMLKKRIDQLDYAEVNFDDEINSAHLKAERFKKRACQVFEKICDLNGNNKQAQRTLKRPIKFNGTSLPEFNKTLTEFVNRTSTFPDYYDVRTCLEHCNEKYNFKLETEEIIRISEDAFVKIGKLLQKRRKMELYETVSYFVGTEKDPADTDLELQEKLARNKSYDDTIRDIIDRYAAREDQGNDPEDNEQLVSATAATSSSDTASASLEAESVKEVEESSPNADAEQNQMATAQSPDKAPAVTIADDDADDNVPVDEPSESTTRAKAELETTPALFLDDDMTFANNLDTFEDDVTTMMAFDSPFEL